MKKKYEVILRSGLKNNYLFTIAIGQRYLNAWKTYSLNNWKQYCKKHSLGLIVITDHLISKKNKYWKKATWQKFLIGDFALKDLKKFNINNICYLDTDFFINPDSPDIFAHANLKKISVVSVRKRIPYPYMSLRKKIAFYRNRFYSSKYPLDSSLFISLRNLYKFHNLKEQKDEACAGLFVFNVKKYTKKFKKWFYLYDKNINSITNGGDQTHFNYHVQNEKHDFWLDYKFQTSWLYDMAWYYPFLYHNKYLKKYASLFIEATLQRCYFLHFAGSWPESDFWKTKNILDSKDKIKFLKSFHKYLNLNVSGKPVGMKRI